MTMTMTVTRLTPMLWRLAWRAALAVVLLGAGGCAPQRVNRLPNTCSRGRVMIKGTRCQSRCTCMANGTWRCISQPCAHHRRPNTCSPGRVVIKGTRCQTRCTCTANGSWRCISQPCAHYRPPPRVTKPRRLPHRPPAVKRAPAPRLVAVTTPPPRHLRVRPTWRVTRRIAANGVLRREDHYYRGRKALTCQPVGGKGRQRCTLAIASLRLPARCWRKPRRGTSNVLRRIKSRAAFKRIFGCGAIAATLNLRNTAVVWVRQTLADNQKLTFSVLRSAKKTELVARISRRCYGIGRHTRRPPSQKHRVLVLPRDGRKISLRLERSKGRCGQIP